MSKQIEEWEKLISKFMEDAEKVRNEITMKYGVQDLSVVQLRYDLVKVLDYLHRSLGKLQELKTCQTKQKQSTLILQT